MWAGHGQISLALIRGGAGKTDGFGPPLAFTYAPAPYNALSARLGAVLAFPLLPHLWPFRQDGERHAGCVAERHLMAL